MRVCIDYLRRARSQQQWQQTATIHRQGIEQEERRETLHKEGQWWEVAVDIVDQQVDDEKEHGKEKEEQEGKQEELD